MKVAIVLLCLVVSSFAQPPSQHPVISETFTCTVSISIVNNCSMILFLQIRGESISKNEDERILFNGKFIMYYIQVCVLF